MDRESRVRAEPPNVVEVYGEGAQCSTQIVLLQQLSCSARALACYHLEQW